MIRLRLNRLLSIIFSNWRLKLQIIIVCTLFIIIIYQHHQLNQAHNASEASNVERKRAADAIVKVSEELKNQIQYTSSNHSNASSSDSVKLQKQILRLDNAALVLGVSPPSATDNKDNGDVCSETYKGTSDWPTQYKSWIVEDCPGHAKHVRKLLTVIFTADTYDQVRDKCNNDHIINIYIHSWTELHNPCGTLMEEWR